MTKEDLFKMEGTITKVLPQKMYKVLLDGDSSDEILVYTSGKMKRKRLQIVVSDRVEVEMTSYDLTRGRIMRRL